MSQPTSAEARTGFSILLETLCIEHSISTPAILAEQLNLDPTLTQKWWDGTSTPERRNETAILRLLQLSSAPALQDWNRLIKLARRRVSGGSTKGDGKAAPSRPALVRKKDGSTVTAAPEPAGGSAPESVTLPTEDGTGKSPDIETEPLPIDGESVSGRRLPEKGTSVPEPAGGSAPESVTPPTEDSTGNSPDIETEPLPIDGESVSGRRLPEEGTAPPPASDEAVLEGRAPAALRRRQVTVWAGAAAVVIGAVGAMPYPSAKVDAGDRCDALAAAIWDARKPASLKGVRFSDLDTTEAMAACSEAVSNHDANPRYHFQLGRIFDRRKDYSHAFTEYLKATDKDPGYAPPFLNIGILYEHGQINGQTRVHQLSHRDLSTAAERYGQAAELDLPNGRYCYAIALLFNWNDHGSDSARAASELRKARDGAVRLGVERDEALIRNIDELISDLRSPNRRTMHVSCDPLRGIDLSPQIIPQ